MILGLSGLIMGLKAHLGSKKVYFWPERANFLSEKVDLGSRRANLGPERATLRPKRADLTPKRDLSSLKGGGRTDIWTNGVWKFTPLSYRTSALWGRCPALTPLLHWITQQGIGYR